MTAHPQASARLHNRGTTLIELMVAIIIGMLMVLASFQVLATFEGHKRSTSAMNDALQSGNFGLYTLDKLARSSGTGLVQSASFAYGCLLNYTSSGGTAVTNGAVTLPAPFTGILSGALPLRLAPAVIFPSATVDATSGIRSDAFLLMSGGAGFSEVPVPITAPPTDTQLIIDSTVGLHASDWVLVGASGVNTCVVTPTQLTLTGAPNNVVVPLNGAYSMAPYASKGFVLGLGGVQSDAASFMMFGVGDDDSLYSLDLLNSDIASTQLVSDDIVTLRAVYGVDPSAAGVGPVVWTDPVAGVSIPSTGLTYDYSPAGLLSGTTAATTALRSIKAIRIAMIVRAPLSERRDASDIDIGAGHAVNAGSYTLFGSLPAAVHVTWTVPAGNEGYRYRVLEGTIPLRNASY